MRVPAGLDRLIASTRLFSRYFLIAAGTLALLGLAAPPIFNLLEDLFNPLPYELVVRMSVGAVAVALMLLGALENFRKDRRASDEVLLIMFVSMLAIFFVMVFDRGHRLMEEFSWIRYSTSGFLGLAALGAWFSARRTNLSDPASVEGDVSWLAALGMF